MSVWGRCVILTWYRLVWPRVCYTSVNSLLVLQRVVCPSWYEKNTLMSKQHVSVLTTNLDIRVYINRGYFGLFCEDSGLFLFLDYTRRPKFHWQSHVLLKISDFFPSNICQKFKDYLQVCTRINWFRICGFSHPRFTAARKKTWKLKK
jgi:hypothetical protein